LFDRNTMNHFIPFTKTQLNELVKKRANETKFGETIDVPQGESIGSFLKNTDARFVLFGIAEDIGVLANYGNAGTAKAWHSFLPPFLTIQANDFTQTNLAIVGHFSFDELKESINRNFNNQETKIQEYRNAVTLIDNAVVELVQLIVSCKKIPIVIGGGHNNSYPIIKGTSLALKSTINCINVDAHIDYRRAEGRHSGNGFRYAKKEGFLKKYFVVGLHENYIPQPIIDEIEKDGEVNFITYESIFVRQEKNWQQSLEEAAQFVDSNSTIGLELDLDAIENISSSAMSPSGIFALEARQYVSIISSKSKIAYLHICEGIPSNETSAKTVGKLISYLVSDFFKSFQS
jgi:formiminoglutamase